MGFCRSILPAIKSSGLYLLAIAGAVGTFSGIYTIWTGHPVGDDRTQPEIHSSFVSTPYCEFTLIKPNITVKDPDPGRWEWKTGLKLVQMYVGADKIGEWPVYTKKKQLLKLEGRKYQRTTRASVGPIITVAEDNSGNIAIKKIKGKYRAPFCFDSELAKENSCECNQTAGIYIQNMGSANGEGSNGKIEHEDTPSSS